MNPRWVRSIRDQCQSASIPFFFKQWGTFAPLKESTTWGETENWEGANNGDGTFCMMLKKGKKAAGRELDGRTWDEYPKEV